jgi:flavin reductase (DIM6/NTAB) family NADH-FMN oxidoreductase RutF
VVQDAETNGGGMSAFSTRDLRDAFGTFATGVAVVTAVRPDGEPVGITANSFTSVSLEPPLLLWCLAAASTNAVAFCVGAPFAVHVLSHEQMDLALHFAQRVREKFHIDPYWRSNPHPPHLSEALCRFDCRVQARYPEGDHVIVVGQVLGVTRHEGVPLVFSRGRFGNFQADRGAAKVDDWQGQWM